MSKAIFGLAVVLGLAGVCFGEEKPLVVDKLADRHESTSADAILTVEEHKTDEGEVLHFKLHLFTEYFSRKGTGRAYAALVIFNRKGQQLDAIEASNTIGAVWNQKRRSQSDDSSITEPADQVGGWVFVIDAEHRHGIPATPADVKTWWNAHREEYLSVAKGLKPETEDTVGEYGIVYRFR